MTNYERSTDLYPLLNERREVVFPREDSYLFDIARRSLAQGDLLTAVLATKTLLTPEGSSNNAAETRKDIVLRSIDNGSALSEESNLPLQDESEELSDLEPKEFLHQLAESLMAAQSKRELEFAKMGLKRENPLLKKIKNYWQGKSDQLQKLDLTFSNWMSSEVDFWLWQKELGNENKVGTDDLQLMVEAVRFMPSIVKLAGYQDSSATEKASFPKVDNIDQTLLLSLETGERGVEATVEFGLAMLKAVENEFETADVEEKKTLIEKSIVKGCLASIEGRFASVNHKGASELIVMTVDRLGKTFTDWEKEKGSEIIGLLPSLKQVLFYEFRDSLKKSLDDGFRASEQSANTSVDVEELFKVLDMIEGGLLADETTEKLRIFIESNFIVNALSNGGVNYIQNKVKHLGFNDKLSGLFNHAEELKKRLSPFVSEDHLDIALLGYDKAVVIVLVREWLVDLNETHSVDESMKAAKVLLVFENFVKQHDNLGVSEIPKFTRMWKAGLIFSITTNLKKSSAKSYIENIGKLVPQVKTRLQVLGMGQERIDLVFKDEDFDKSIMYLMDDGVVAKTTWAVLKSQSGYCGEAVGEVFAALQKIGYSEAEAWERIFQGNLAKTARRIIKDSIEEKIKSYSGNSIEWTVGQLVDYFNEILLKMESKGVKEKQAKEWILADSALIEEVMSGMKKLMVKSVINLGKSNPDYRMKQIEDTFSNITSHLSRLPIDSGHHSWSILKGDLEFMELFTSKWKNLLDSDLKEYPRRDDSVEKQQQYVFSRKRGFAKSLKDFGMNENMISHLLWTPLADDRSHIYVS